jgi:hypothetical protein
MRSGRRRSSSLVGSATAGGSELCWALNHHLSTPKIIDQHDSDCEGDDPDRVFHAIERFAEKSTRMNDFIDLTRKR